MLAIKFTVLVMMILIAYSLGYVLTEVKPLSRYGLFRFTAFQCRPCLSFHIAWVSETFFSLLFDDWTMAMVGWAFSVMLYLGLRKDENNKVIKLEDYDSIL